MIKYAAIFVLGIYVGQDHSIPNVRKKALELYSELQKTDIYKQFMNENKK
jgi:hypothetical protein